MKYASIIVGRFSKIDFLNSRDMASPDAFGLRNLDLHTYVGVKMLTIDKLPNVSPMIRLLHTVSMNDLVWNVEFLPFRERSFLIYRLRGLTYTEIGKKFKVSAERARQIVRDATKKLLQEDRFAEIDGKLHLRGPHNVWCWGRTLGKNKSTKAILHSYLFY